MKKNQILTFILSTLLYIPIQYTMAGLDGSFNMIAFSVYVLVVFLSAFGFNVDATKSLCGSPQWTTSAVGTIVPWGVIFGSVIVLLMFFSGWLSPFANTFGYGVVALTGASSLVTDILKPVSGDANASKVEEAVATIYGDKSLFINQIPWNIDEFVEFWKTSRPLFRKSVADASNTDQAIMGLLEDPSSLARRALNMARMRMYTSLFVWYVLAGTLAASAASAFCADQGCEYSAAQLDKMHQDYLSDEKKAAEERDKNPERVYTTND